MSAGRTLALAVSLVVVVSLTMAGGKFFASVIAQSMGTLLDALK